MYIIWRSVHIWIKLYSIYTSMKYISLNLRWGKVGLKATFHVSHVHAVLQKGSTQLQAKPLIWHTHTTTCVFSVHHRPLKPRSLGSDHFHLIATLLLRDTSAWIASRGTDCLYFKLPSSQGCLLSEEPWKLEDSNSASLQSKEQVCFLSCIIKVTTSFEAKGRETYCPLYKNQIL